MKRRGGLPFHWDKGQTLHSLALRVAESAKRGSVPLSNTVFAPTVPVSLVFFRTSCSVESAYASGDELKV